MPERRFRRERHQVVAAALDAMNGAFLGTARCGFGGGTRIVLELGEYRESEDLDFLCASRPGYRALRSTVTERSLGDILRAPVPLAREVRADRYGIRTFLEIGGRKVKLEIVNEGRIDLALEQVRSIPVPCLDRVSCFAEKFLANADRGSDDATLGRDAIDLAFTIEAWGTGTAAEGAAIAREAYGSMIDRAAKAAGTRLLERKEHLKRCIAALAVTRQKELVAGLRALASGSWLAASGTKANARRRIDR